MTGTVKGPVDYDELFTPENRDAANLAIEEKGLQELAGLSIRHTLDYPDGRKETFESTVEEAFVICPPFRSLSAPLLQAIIPASVEKYKQAHPEE